MTAFNHIRTAGAAALIAFASPIGAALAAEQGGGVGMPQLDPSSFPSQLFWLVVSFLVLFLLMWKVALPRVGEVIEQRQQKVSADLERAEKLKEEVEQVTAEYEKLLSEARASAQEEFRRTQDQLKTEYDNRIARHDTELSAMISEAEGRIADARKDAMAELQNVAEEIAAESVAKLTGNKPEGAAVKKAVQSAAKEA
ncbi:MAG: F0F1 ATP synthase subunit B' [Marivibrio sp.]|uniref:F0F1 ATP synthase subunit B family protein n=1 Tax=Marivibrio sp. TaxID=2039719 RepID=UPI0032EAB870